MLLHGTITATATAVVVPAAAADSDDYIIKKLMRSIILNDGKPNDELIYPGDSMSRAMGGINLRSSRYARHYRSTQKTRRYRSNEKEWWWEMMSVIVQDRWVWTSFVSVAGTCELSRSTACSAIAWLICAQSPVNHPSVIHGASWSSLEHERTCRKH